MKVVDWDAAYAIKHISILNWWIWIGIVLFYGLKYRVHVCVCACIYNLEWVFVWPWDCTISVGSVPCGSMKKTTPYISWHWLWAWLQLYSVVLYESNEALSSKTSIGSHIRTPRPIAIVLHWCENPHETINQEEWSKALTMCVGVCFLWDLSLAHLRQLIIDVVQVPRNTTTIYQR